MMYRMTPSDHLRRVHLVREEGRDLSGKNGEGGGV
jgi:hypothetical protein